jgi:hypothetical protein
MRPGSDKGAAGTDEACLHPDDPILRKLDINDFELDESSLHTNMNPYLAYADKADDETTSTADE